MEAIKQITAIQIIKQTDTNSVPFLVLCDDGELYYAKTMFKAHPPFEDVINEILSVYFLDLMGVKTIPPALIKVPQVVFESYKLEHKNYDARYDNLKFDNKQFFGSLFQPSTTEVEVYNTTLQNKHDFNKYTNPTDFLKIGLFDYWIGNMDRRGSNPNILINETIDGKFEFLPIDHTQAFGYQNNYKALKISLMNKPNPKSILKTPISKSILSFADSIYIANFHNEILADFSNVITNIGFVFDQIPSTFGLSSKGKDKIIEILSNQKRNLIVSRIHLNI
ncbi:hypothetical protein DHD32_16330 [Arenibacter sp. TNZ]|uniref:HipA family kinase n=1 Tax=Arenibacter TaxID=178469 RepID=UPI000CD426B4|nr:MULTISPECIES: HipA family kinase [Arenibacter]MCM4173053.1 hypothetical protein [Arenibacter sp. TNZ]